MVTVVILDTSSGRQPARIHVAPLKVDLAVEEETRLIAFAEDAYGVMVPEVRVVWEMANATAGAVTPDGRFVAGRVAGSFLGAIRARLAQAGSGQSALIASTIDVVVRSEAERNAQLYPFMLPQVVFLRPQESLVFKPIVLDARGQTLRATQVLWQVTNPQAGTISAEGRFQAGDAIGEFEDAVVAEMVVPTRRGPIQVRAVASITVDTAFGAINRPLTAPKAVIFPERIEMSSAESFNFSVVALDERGRQVRNPNVSWELDPAIGQVDEFGRVRVVGAPGEYANVLRATVTLGNVGTQVVQKLTATVVIRGPLSGVEIRPSPAEVVPRGRLQFRATAYDANGVVLPDVAFVWSVLDSRAGSISRDGFFRAGQASGEYPDSIRVQAVERRRR
jgi:hypothetical protein